MSAMTDVMDGIDFAYEKNGQILCTNQKGLIFFLQAEPPAPIHKPEARPAAPAPAWQPMEAVVEVEVRRSNEPMPIHEATRSGPAPVRGTTPLQEPVAAKAAAAPTEKGWFGKLFAK